MNRRFANVFGRRGESFEPTEIDANGLEYETATAGEAAASSAYLRRTLVSRLSERDSTCRTVLIFGFSMVILAALLIGLSLLSIRTSFESTHTVQGERGPMGICNLSHANQTFLVAGNTIIGDNLTVGNALNLPDVSIYSNGSCIVFDSNLPLCIETGIKTNYVNSTVPNGQIVVGGSIYTEEDATFCGDLNVCTTFNIGGASFVWNGTYLTFTGPSNLGSLVTVPLNVGSSGTIDQLGNCMFFNANQCLVVNGTTTFLSGINGPLSVNGTATFNPAVYVVNSSYGMQFVSPSGGLNVFSNAGPLVLSAPSSIVSVVSPLLNVTQDVSVYGTVQNLLKLSSAGLQTTCTPGPQTGGLAFSPGCGCLTLSSTSGICLNAAGTQGITASGGGNFTVTGPSMNLNFASGASIGTPVTVNGALSVNGASSVSGNSYVGGDLTVAGNFSFTNLYVSGTSYFSGPIVATNPNNNFTGINAVVINSNITVSKVLTTFQGGGAVFAPGSTLQVTSNFYISSLASQLKCASPIFIPNTPSTPNNFSCVPECTDMQRCSPKVANLEVVGLFKVGTDYTTTTIGNVSLGAINGKQMGYFNLNAASVIIQSPSPVSVMGDVDITGSIFQLGSVHPCCTGVGGPALWLVAEMSTITSSLANSEITKIPFDVIQNPSSSLVSNFNTVTNTFTSGVGAMYSITVYLSMDPAQYLLGTFRGVTLIRTFSFPTSTMVPIRICSQRTDFTTPPIPFQITCTYNAFLQAGDMFYVTGFFNFAGPLTINGASSVVTKPTTRLEIYRF